MIKSILKKLDLVFAIVVAVTCNNHSYAQRVADVMPFYDVSSSKFYVFYLRDIWNDVTHQRHPWNALTTTDLSSYTEIGEKLSCSSDPCKQDYAIGTGSVIKNGSTYYAFYTGHNPNAPSSCAPKKEGIMLATSANPNSSFSKSINFTTIYAPAGYDGLDNFRDPYVFKDGNTFYMLVSARTSVNGAWRGVIAKFVSNNLLDWTYNGILYDGGTTNFFMMECAQILKMGATNYLIYSDINSKNVHYRKSSSFNGPWGLPVGSDILSNVGYAARTESNGTNRYIWGWTVVGTTWAGQLKGNLLTQSSNGDLVVTSITPVTGVDIPPTSLTLGVGQTSILTANVYPSNATNTTVTWTSSNTAIATVNGSGAVAAIAPGSATITVRTVDGGLTDNCAVTVTGSISGIVSGATYRIVSRQSGKSILVSGGSTGDGANVSSSDYSGASNQQWILIDIGGGFYKLIAKHSGKAMDMASGSLSNGANVQQWSYLSYTNQQWSISNLGGGYYKIISRHSGKALDLDGSSANVQQWDYLGGTNQQWQLIKMSDPGTMGMSFFENDLSTLEWRSEGTDNDSIYPTIIEDYFTLHLGAYITSEHSQMCIDFISMDGRIYNHQIASGLKKVTMSAKALGMTPGVYIVKIQSANPGSQLRVIVK